MHTGVEVRGQLAGGSSFLRPHGSWATNLGCETWCQLPLPVEASLWPEPRISSPLYPSATEESFPAPLPSALRTVSTHEAYPAITSPLLL